MMWASGVSGARWLWRMVQLWICGCLVSWVTDITEHPTSEGTVYCAAAMDAYSRLIVGWFIAEHMHLTRRRRTRHDHLRRQPDKQPGDRQIMLHFDHGSQYTSWVRIQRGLFAERDGPSRAAGQPPLDVLEYL